MIHLYQYEISPGEKAESIPYLQRAVLEYFAEAGRNLRLDFKRNGKTADVSKPKEEYLVFSKRKGRSQDGFISEKKVEDENIIVAQKNGGKQNLLLSVQIVKTEKGKPEVKLVRAAGGVGIRDCSEPVRQAEVLGKDGMTGLAGLTEPDRFAELSEPVKFARAFGSAGETESFHLPDLHISATHTKNLVICAVGRENIGIDGEVPEERSAKISYEKIAARFFTERELNYVKQAGSEGFFEIWVRKEAYMKYTGEGMAYGFKNIETRGASDFLEKINGCRVLFLKRDGLYFACAGGRTELVWR